MAEKNLSDVFCRYADEYWVSAGDPSAAQEGERLRLVLGASCPALRPIDEAVAERRGQALAALVQDAGHALVAIGDDTVRPLHWLLGRLWKSTEELPLRTRDTLGLPPGATYGEAAHRVAAATDRSIVSFREWYLFVWEQ